MGGGINRNKNGVIGSENGRDKDGGREETSNDREHVSLDESRHWEQTPASVRQK